ncbi:YopX family protein [Paenibacillus sp. D9]|uniref:YopX family protein n=1 Tax=Paenibacillus sp. D9 TaxID=665792 RepID=UPI000675FFB4|nr:YopX family protein [Paenibacillus sp. D9]
MGRDYKFRLWDAEKGVMHNPGDRPFWISPWGVPVYNDTPLQCILMQYTGLKDKNGTEIYEADLLDDGDGIGEVEWVQEHCAFMVFYRTESGSVYGYLESDGQLKSTVVRGNIHQHPELLKEGDGS